MEPDVSSPLLDFILNQFILRLHRLLILTLSHLGLCLPRRIFETELRVSLLYTHVCSVLSCNMWLNYEKDISLRHVGLIAQSTATP